MILRISVHSSYISAVKESDEPRQEWLPVARGVPMSEPHGVDVSHWQTDSSLSQSLIQAPQRH